MSESDQGGTRGAARRLIAAWKGPSYAFGLGCLPRAGELAGQVTRRAVILANTSPWLTATVAAVEKSLATAGVAVVTRERGARPNAPREDLYRMAEAVRAASAEGVVAIGGGSTIDAAKAAAVLATLADDPRNIDAYFGVGKVTEALAAKGRTLPVLVAVQTASGSAAHLTKYSNITDLDSAQKKLIVDDAIVPPRAVFDYELTRTAPADLTADGALDGVAHMIEVYYGAQGKQLKRAEPIAKLGVDLIVGSLAAALESPHDPAARDALGLGTDLGGLAIMIGGTNGAHLTSFSLVDILSHGRACALMNPYYTVFFAPAIERQLRVLGDVYRRHGLVDAQLDRLGGRDLGLAVAEGMLALSRRIGFPATLAEVPGFEPGHVERALTAAKDPQLAMKLKNMPVPLSADQVDDCMGPVLEAARTGNLSTIRNLS